MIATAEQLIDRAIAATGQDDFGPDGWQVGLDTLLASVAEPGLSTQSIRTVEQLIVSRLTRRLSIECWYEEHPQEITPVEALTVVMGLPRTATTAMQHVLALDPAFRYQRLWEIRQPVPPPHLDVEGDDPRRQAAIAAIPPGTGGSVQHIASVDGPVDDGTILGLDFHNQELGIPVWSYTTWWRSADLTSTYEYHRRVLQLLHAHRPPRTWLVKAPYHNFHLEDLARAYPEARFVMTHRDPAAAFPSACSTVASARRDLLPAEDHDPERLGRFLLEHLTDGIRRAMAAREQIGDERFLDVSQHDFEKDPVGTVERTYAFLGRELTADLGKRVETWAAKNQRGARGEHRYRAEDYGQSTRSIRLAFSDYISRFEVQPEIDG